MKICYLLGGFSSGGIGRVVSILANQQIFKNHTVYAVTLFPNVEKEIYTLSPEVHRWCILEKKKPVRYVLPKAAYLLRKYIKKNSIDLIIACGNVMYPVALLAYSKTTKVIYWEHSNVFNTNDNKGQTALRWLASKFATKIITLTDCDKNGFVKKFHSQKIQRIYNPIDPELFISNSTFNLNSKKIISVGRFCYQKYFEQIPIIAKKLKEITNDWEWHIYGTGETIQTVKILAKQLDVADKLFFEGQVSSLYKEYNKYACIVMTSRYEGFPMTLLEAAANALPLISYDVLTGPNEIISSGKNGYLIPFGDTDQMALKISMILKNDNLRSELSKNSLLTTSKFCVNQIVNEWEILFNSCR